MLGIRGTDVGPPVHMSSDQRQQEQTIRSHASYRGYHYWHLPAVLFLLHILSKGEFSCSFEIWVSVLRINVGYLNCSFGENTKTYSCFTPSVGCCLSEYSLTLLWYLTAGFVCKINSITQIQAFQWNFFC